MKNLPYMYNMSQSEFLASLTFLELEKNRSVPLKSGMVDRGP